MDAGSASRRQRRLFKNMLKSWSCDPPLTKVNATSRFGADEAPSGARRSCSRKVPVSRREVSAASGIV
eukprot:6952084-Prymnesium_polylepis.1